MAEQPITPPGHEKRGTFRLLSYWSTMKGDREFPKLEELSVQVLEDMWHLCFVIEIRDPIEESVFQYFGPELATVFNTNHGGEPVKQAFEDDWILENTVGFFPKIIKERQPITESSEFFLEGDEVRYRSLIVPLSSDGKKIDYVMGTTNYKIFPKNA